MATMEDLIATISSSHVGNEGYEIRALQAQLKETLYPTAGPSYHYRPVLGQSFLPAAPATSLSSQISNSSYHAHHPLSYASPHTSSFPLNHQQPPSALGNGTGNNRPQITPVASYRGFVAGAVGGVGSVGDAMHLSSPSYGHSELPSPPFHGDEDDEYEAFEGDAFAPLCAPGGVAGRTKSPRRTGGGGGAWEGFKRRGEGAWGVQGQVVQPAPRHNDPPPPMEGEDRDEDEDDAMDCEEEVEVERPSRTGMPTPPEERMYGKAGGGVGVGRGSGAWEGRLRGVKGMGMTGMGGGGGWEQG